MYEPFQKNTVPFHSTAYVCFISCFLSSLFFPPVSDSVLPFQVSLPSTEGIKWAGLKVAKYRAAPQSKAVAHSSSFFKRYGPCQYLSAALNQCSSRHSSHEKCYLQYTKGQCTDYQGADAAHGTLCCSLRSKGLEVSGLNAFVHMCPHCPADTWNRYSNCTAAPETFCYRLP